MITQLEQKTKISRDVIFNIFEFLDFNNRFKIIDVKNDKDYISFMSKKYSVSKTKLIYLINNLKNNCAYCSKKLYINTKDVFFCNICSYCEIIINDNNNKINNSIKICCQCTETDHHKRGEMLYKKCKCGNFACYIGISILS